MVEVDLSPKRARDVQERLEARLTSDRIVDGGYVSIPPGWVPIVDNLDRLLGMLDPGYQILQVKEKFGGLRFYVAPESPDDFNPIIRSAESASFAVCQVCAQPGQLILHEYTYATLCDEHAPEGAREVDD